MLILQNSFIRLGDLENGQAASVDLSLGSFQSGMQGAGISWRFFEDQYNGLSGPPRETEFKRMVT